MTNLLLALAVATAVAAAFRSTWSPCGLSMLSTITPMAEHSRGRRWTPTAAWFVLGATLGGATLGLLAMPLALAVRALDLSSAAALGAATCAAVLAVALDLGLTGRPMPHHRRQVNEAWLDQYRSWVYGAGFGWQIGTGLMTYIMTAAVYLTIVFAALSGAPLTALAITTLFGFTRGLMILLGVRLTDPERLRVFHRRFEEAGPAVRRALIVVQAVVALVASGAAWGAPGVVAVAVVLAGLAGVAALRRSPSGRTDAVAVPTAT